MDGVVGAFAHLLADFADETLPHVEAAAEVVLELERAWDAPALPAARLDELRARLHTVKGNAAMMGLAAIAQVAHALEDACATLAEAPRARRGRAIDLLLGGCDLLDEQTRAAARGELDDARARAFLDAGVGAEPGAEAGTGARGAAGDAVRLDLRRLDELLALAGEASVAQGTLARGFGAAGAPPPALVALDRALASLRRRLLEARLVPLAPLFARFARYVRDLARERGQPIRLAVSGGDVPIDKAVVDRLHEPLVHLVRNAVAHGLEAPAERARLGKPAEATIRLEAKLAPGGAVVTVADDGRGLDVPRILARAAERFGIDAAALDADEAARLAAELIWRPGFSTASGVSALAGRGVGLDAVTAALHAMGGSVDVISTPGRGAAFRVRVPTSLVLARGLLCHAGDERFLVGAGAVRETLRVRQEALRQVERQRLLPWRGALLGVVDPGELLGVALRSAAPSCLVLESGARRRGLLVDRAIGQLEVVVQPLAPALGRPRWFSGAAILAGGDVVLILDAARLVEDAGGGAPAEVADVA